MTTYNLDNIDEQFFDENDWSDSIEEEGIISPDEWQDEPEESELEEE